MANFLGRQNKCYPCFTELRILRNIARLLLWTIIIGYILSMVVVRLPYVQNVIGSRVAAILSDKLGTKVVIGRVDLGFFNRLILDDVMIYDQACKEMLRARRLSVKVELPPLVQGRIAISSAQVFGAKACLYQVSPDIAPNYQFVIDSLASKDTVASNPLDLRINSLIIRQSSVSFDRYDVAPTPGRFNPAHVGVRDISAHILLKALRDDSVNVVVKKLMLKEQSGIVIDRISLKAEGGLRGLDVSDFLLKMPGSNVSMSRASMRYSVSRGKIVSSTIRYDAVIDKSTIAVDDISPFLPDIGDISGNTYTLEAALSGTGDDHNINRISVSGIIPKAGVVRLTTQARYSSDRGLSAKGGVYGDIGAFNFDAFMSADKHFNGEFTARNLNVGKLIGEKSLGELSASINAEGSLAEGKDNVALSAKGKIHKLRYNGYDYSNIDLDGKYDGGDFTGKVAVGDENANMAIQGYVKRNGGIYNILCDASVRRIVPSALKLTSKWGKASFSTNIHADITARSLNDSRGILSISDFTLSGDGRDYHIDNFDVTTGYEDNEHYVVLSSDFASMRLTGDFDYQTLPQSFNNIVASKLPTLPGLLKTRTATNNNFTLNASLVKSDFFERMFGVDLHFGNHVSLSAKVNDSEKTMDVWCNAPDIEYAGNRFRHSRVHLVSDRELLRCEAAVTNVADNGRQLELSLTADASENTINTMVKWENRGSLSMNGTLNMTGKVVASDNATADIFVDVLPSVLTVGNANWEVMPSKIHYTRKHVDIDNFLVRHEGQHVSISGTASAAVGDTLTAELKDVDVAYVLDLVGFDAVSFSGNASGVAHVVAPFGNLGAWASLNVGDFKFEHGRMGVLTANARWNSDEGQIDIDALANDGPGALTKIHGYVSPTREYIDLDIMAAGTRLDFMHSFTKSFLGRIEGNVNGSVRLAGPLSTINLTGDVVVDGEADVKPLNTTYRLLHDSVHLVPDEIMLNRVPVADKYNNVGLLSGAIHHKHLTRLTYDLGVEADNLLSYDFTDFGDDTFYGTVFATGSVDIHGRSGEVVINADITPQKNSVFVYNASNPDAITKQEFIEWNDVTFKKPAESTRKNDFQSRMHDIPTDIHLNLSINCTHDATLKLLMDSRTSDYITLNGNGVLRATYYNKGSFNLFGTYEVEQGTYGITIQDLIRKNFQFSSGGTIAFGGDPYEAVLNLQAVHSVSGVSLSDLNIGNSFSSNTVRVNCLMNISGQTKSPQVDFDIDMPTVSSDEKQMVRSVINSQDEMNQQVLYLLGIGRFYPQAANNAGNRESQQNSTSLAMQSLLSGTISSQINNVLSSVIKSNNWNFGANISTGDEGWNNAEYEGLLSGRLLNNRLLINGQFGYRDRTTSASPSFIGDFDVRYLLHPNGNFAVKVYNQTNDRYFTKSSLNTQGIGLIMKKDFSNFSDLFGRKKKAASILNFR